MGDPVLGRALTADDWAYLAIRATVVEPHSFDDLTTAANEVAAGLHGTDGVTWEDLVDRHVAVGTTLARMSEHELEGHEDAMVVLVDALDPWYRKALLFAPAARFWVKVLCLRLDAYRAAEDTPATTA